MLKSIALFSYHTAVHFPLFTSFFKTSKDPTEFSTSSLEIWGTDGANCLLVWLSSTLHNFMKMSEVWGGSGYHSIFVHLDLSKGSGQPANSWCPDSDRTISCWSWMHTVPCPIMRSLNPCKLQMEWLCLKVRIRAGEMIYLVKCLPQKLQNLSSNF